VHQLVEASMTRSFVPPTLLAALAIAPLPAQNVFHGNGIGGAYIQNTPAVVDRAVRFQFGSPGLGNGLAVLSLSGGIGPFQYPHPLIGLIGLDPTHPFYAPLLFVLDGNGDAALSIPLPAGLGAASTPPFFANTLTVEGPVFSISRTTRVEWANWNGWEPVAALADARQLHTATALGAGPRDNVSEVLIAGGATGSITVPFPIGSAELFTPLTRTVTPLPPLSLPRAGHRAVRLPDGRVLLCGGVTTGGLVTATCELFDPTTGTFGPTGSMTAPRSAHAITLLDDGRVLASGGFADYQNTATNFIAALNTAQDTAEVYDAATGLWSPLPVMAARRAGHSQTKLPDGRVLVVSGINGGWAGPSGGGQIPTYTPSCEVFDPGSATFAPTAALVSSFFGGGARAFHGASLLPNGSVLVTGGFVPSPALGANGEASSDETCVVWAGTGWVDVGLLPEAVAFHTQVPFANGALIVGGFVGNLGVLATTAMTVLHDGLSAGSASQIGIDAGTGVAQPRAAHTCTGLCDGTLLVYGGGLWPATLADGWVFTATP
jgi:hypothetical protein